MNPLRWKENFDLSFIMSLFPQKNLKRYLSRAEPGQRRCLPVHLLIRRRFKFQHLLFFSMRTSISIVLFWWVFLKTRSNCGCYWPSNRKETLTALYDEREKTIRNFFVSTWVNFASFARWLLRFMLPLVSSQNQSRTSPQFKITLSPGQLMRVTSLLFALARAE